MSRGFSIPCQWQGRDGLDWIGVMRSYRCSLCEKPVEYEGPRPSLYPFCSERCKMVDLGKWLREEYTIDRDLTSEDVGDTRNHLRISREE